MATLREAELARKKFAEHLRGLGAHAVAVDQVKHRGKKTFAVIPFFEKKPRQTVPEVLEVRSAGKKVRVPAVVRIQERFKLE